MNVESLISAHIQQLEAYEPPDWEAVAQRAGTTPARLVRLDANENPYGPPPRVRPALARFADYGFYPDYRVLKRAVARYARAEPENVVLANGGDEVIDLAVRVFVEPGQGVFVCPPAFGMYAISTLAHRGRVLEVRREPDFSTDVEGIEALCARAGDGAVQPKLLFLTSPGNPDGQIVPIEIVRRLLKLPMAVVVDEAYVDFGAESVVPLLGEYPNLLVLRTFSKWAGMAGLRLGYAVASPAVVEAMERLRPPYNVNAAATVAALATFEDMAYVQETIERIVSERQRLQNALSDLPGARALPSQANFVLCRFEGRSGRQVAEALAARGILVRSFSDASLVDAVRITIGRPEQNEMLLDALQGVLAPGTDPQSGASTEERRAASEAQAAAGHSSRQGEIWRQTAETEVSVRLGLDGSGRYRVDTGLGFLDHMLAQVAAHGLFDLEVQARGDLEVDEHHTVEDVAIALGDALDEALADRRGLVRIGHAYAPLDEALARVVVDLSGRPYAVVEAEFSTPRVGAVDTDLLVHFLETLASHGRLSLHAQVLSGRNDHHRAEALFKALGRALDAATRLDPRRVGVPSTKGVL
jgi:histidinol-phosphate aminotransferase